MYYFGTANTIYNFGRIVPYVGANSRNRGQLRKNVRKSIHIDLGYLDFIHDHSFRSVRVVMR